MTVSLAHRDGAEKLELQEGWCVVHLASQPGTIVSRLPTHSSSYPSLPGLFPCTAENVVYRPEATILGPDKGIKVRGGQTRALDGQTAESPELASRDCLVWSCSHTKSCGPVTTVTQPHCVQGNAQGQRGSV